MSRREKRSWRVFLRTAPSRTQRAKYAALLFSALAGVALSFFVPNSVRAADEKNYGKVGDPIDLTVGY